ncbi:hypothetical protein N7522_005539 [Penicillium canescens]|nr:hypothetical protein N7522_005539 [Penicillium canescens]
MDYMPGKRLDEAWDTLDSDQKLSIASELHDYINQLRDLNGGYIGAIDRSKAVIGQFASIEGGPFDSEQQFNELILGDIVKSTPDILRHYAKFALMQDHEIFLLTPISARVISLSKEAGSQLSLTGNMLAGIRNTGNISRRFGN